MFPGWFSSALGWFVAGAILLLAELTIGGFLAIFFAAGAWVTAFFLWIGLIEEPIPSLMVFLVVSVLSIIVLRRKLQPIVGGAAAGNDTDRELEDFIGHRATVVETIDALKHKGKVEFRGALWDARADTRIEAGSVVVIRARDNIVLRVEPIEGRGTSGQGSESGLRH